MLGDFHVWGLGEYSLSRFPVICRILREYLCRRSPCWNCTYKQDVLVKPRAQSDVNLLGCCGASCSLGMAHIWVDVKENQEPVSFVLSYGDKKKKRSPMVFKVSNHIHFMQVPMFRLRPWCWKVNFLSVLFMHMSKTLLSSGFSM